MKARYEQRLRTLSGMASMLQGGLRGVEKECLRVTPDGFIAASDHPEALGSALTNPYITTDYSEALIEFITPPRQSAEETLAFLDDLHHFTHGALGEELLWAMSMPCRLRSEEDIPIARYGSSNAGRMKTIYRRGLGFRYGRYMQAIAGVHFNYSLPESFWPVFADLEGLQAGPAVVKNNAYLALVRNVRRLDWLLLYLFGASPAVCRCFLARGHAGLQEFDRETLYAPHATSLRMSDIGYKNANQAGLYVSADSLDTYIADLTRAIRTPHPQYEKIGVRVGDEYRQLSSHQLQIENEYYSTIRPKRLALSGERPTAALLRGGVEYVELRAIDLDPQAPAGTSLDTLRFAEIFLLYALLLDSPPVSPVERDDIEHNHLAVARRGREPGLTLRHRGEAVAMTQLAGGHLEAMQGIAELLDAGGAGHYRSALRACAVRIEDPQATPSAQLLQRLRDSGMSLGDFGLEISARHRRQFLARPPAANAHYPMLRSEARDSLERQRRLEAEETSSFEEYLAAWYA